MYIVEPDVLQELIVEAVGQAMERYTSTNTPAPADGEEMMMTRDEVAKFLHVSLATLNNWARLGYLVPVRVGRRVLYNSDRVRQFANTNTKSN